jgi:hypothetical protein
MPRFASPLLATALLALSAGALSGQQRVGPLQPGDTAPDFAVTGATRYGILAEPVRLSDFRGETVVLAFFFQARTPG